MRTERSRVGFVAERAPVRSATASRAASSTVVAFGQPEPQHARRGARRGTRPRRRAAPAAGRVDARRARAATASTSASSPRNCSVRCHWSRVVRAARAPTSSATRSATASSTASGSRTATNARVTYGSASRRWRNRFSSEIVENWRTRSRSPGRRVLTASTVPSGSAIPKHTVPDRDAVLLGRAGDTRDRDADVGAEHALRALAPSARADSSLTTSSAVTPSIDALHVGRVRADRAAERLARARHVRDPRRRSARR